MTFRVLAFRIAYLIVYLCLSGPSLASGQSNEKLDPVLKLLVSSVPGATSPTLRPLVKVTNGAPTVDVFIQTAGATSFATPGVEVQSVLGSIVIASVPISQLEALAGEPQVTALYAAKIWKPMLDKSVHETRADSVRTPFNVTGNGVIVGVIDTGIDWKHREFRLVSDTTKTRIKFLWDMSDNTGPPPTGFVTDGTRGTEWTEAQINQGLAGTLTVTEKDIVGHGTHVAGIAAGLQGMAPGASLIIVKASRSGAEASFLSTDVVNALNYINARAGSLGKPYVVNMSLGGQQGPHDGRAAEELGIDTIVGSGKNKKVVVVAAGNDGNARIHAGGTLNANPFVFVSETLETVLPGRTISIDVWIKATIPPALTFRVTGPDTLFQTSGFSGVTSANHTDGTISVFSSTFQFNNVTTDVNTNIDITTKKSGVWTISVEGNPGHGTGDYDMWIYSGNAQWSASDGDFARLIGTPGSSKNAITVGSYATKTSWTDVNSNSRSVSATVGKRSSFSSPGPSRDGRQKPEISAPGQVIASALSSDVNPGVSPAIFNSSHILAGSKQAMAQGTSMATPHVAGAVALVLEEVAKRDTLFDAIQIRTALQNSARSDAATGAVPNADWGFGKMDVDALFVLLFGAPRASVVTLTTLTAEADGRRVRLDWTIADPVNHAGFRVYRSTGLLPDSRQLLTAQLLTGGPHLTFTDTPPAAGTYAYWLEDVDTQGNTSLHGPLVITFTNTPSSFRLAQSRPNPFNPTTTIAYDLPSAEQVVLRIYDTLGRQVRTLINERQVAGFHEVVWDGRNQEGRLTGSGIYFYTLTAGDFAQSRKMTLLK